jgi:glycosyltransferase involved in cell wall biosynthesis
MKFSVIIPCFNHAHFIDESISSLISQTYANWEAIIINDGSVDDTAEIADSWCKKDTRIKLISTANNGLSSARNTGIEFSTGEIISLLDADDKYEPNHLSLLIHEFYQKSDIVFTGYTYFSISTTIQHTVRLDEGINFSNILYGNIVPPVAVAFRRSILNISGYFDTSLKSAEDWDLWIRCLKVGASLGISKEPSALYRISANSMSRQFSTMYEALKNVSIQAYTFDCRISIDYSLNKNLVSFNFDSIKKHLLLCIGVAIVQNKISVAIDIFKKEMETFNLTFNSNDFKYFCSYLSFRYYISKDDLTWIFETLHPQFLSFFTQLSLPGLDINKTMNQVFSIHNKIRNKQKWGFISPLVNRIS